jgi:DNA-nicking Smr family endonuclease
MSKKSEISEEEKSLFRDSLRGVKPLPKPTTITPEPPRPKPVRRKQQNFAEEVYAPYSDFDKETPVSSEDLIEFSRSGLQHKNLRKLRAGQYNVEAILDLHGMTGAESKEALFHFLQGCQQEDARHVLIIHGKGRNNSTPPILKNKLNNWLRQIEDVIAFCSATGRDGRSGAMYVLLRNQKREKKS